MSIDRLLAKLDRVQPRGPGSWNACCPSHLDRTPSLSVREYERGIIVLHCFAGCPVADILSALDLTFFDLFPHSHAPRIPRARREAREHARMVALVAREDLRAGKTLSTRDRATALWAIRVLKRAPWTTLS